MEDKDTRFHIHKSKDFDGTDYVEIGPGKYDRKHWQDGFVFVCEDDFFVAEGIICKYLRNYDHYDMNNVSRKIGLAIVEEWKMAADALTVREQQAFEILCLKHENEESKKYLEKNRSQIAMMLNELAASCEGFIQDRSEFCILGL